MSSQTDAGGDRRPSTEKQPIVTPAFDRLPDEIIEQILQATDPNSFASLILLNPTWRRVSQQAHLYAHHLSECPSYSASHNALPASAINEDNLPKLRKLFAKEVKRNLFEAYLRPNETIIKLISNSISSSSCPGGEGMQFSPSPRGHHILAYNSSRIYVIDMRGRDIDVKRELKILRRPVSTCIKDDGYVLAVLSSEMQVDIYDLKVSPPRRTQSIILDHTPRTIALSPCGSVLAAAYEGGIEVSSLSPGALSTDRRAVKCDGVDTLAFSFDGTQILGTTIHSSPPNTVILTAPYYDPGSAMDDGNMSQLWTTSILFPNTSRDCSHAVLLQDSSQEEASWTFTYDRSFETFRAVRIDDLRNGTTYFTGPIPSPTSQAKLLPCTLPAATYHGELVSAGFQGKEVWLYGVPEDLDAVPDCASSTTDSGSSSGGLGRRNSGPPSRSSSRTAEASGGRLPQWQLLCDKLRNTFVWGCKVGELDGVSNVKWVAGFGDSSAKERLVVAARGILPPKPITEEDDIDFIDGGRITLLDFDYRITDGVKTEITIEVGTKEPEVLEEEQRDMATEVAIVRRRTVAQKRGDRTGLLRTATTAGSQAPAMPGMPAMPPPPGRREQGTDDDPLVPRRVGAAPRTNVQPASPTSPSEDPDSASIEEQEALDAPYSHASPRSGTTLRRAATAAAINRRLHPPPAAAGPVEYRRADGRREHPHESDADNWVPPPPPYQKEDPGDMPAFLRHAAVVPAGLSTPAQPPRMQTQTAAPTVGPSAWPQPQDQPVPQRFQTSQTLPPAWENRQSANTSQQGQSIHNRIASDSTSMSRPRAEDFARPMSSPSAHVDIDDIYDVSPPDSPRLPATRPSNSQANQSENQNASGNFNSQQASNTRSSYEARIPSSSTVSTVPSAPSPRETTRAIPMLDLQIPSPTFSSSLQWTSTDSGGTSGHLSGAPPSGRRLSNSQTWPTAPKPPTGLQAGPHTGYPYSAPPTGANASDMLAAALPPLPRPDQLASLNDRMNHGSPRRLSGGFSSTQRVPVGGRTGPDSRRSSGQQQAPPLHLSGSSYRGPEPDQPLIISTPRGVTGAYDPPNRQTSGRRNETPLLAPIPRHPRPGQSGPQRPTVERLETIYSIASTGGVLEREASDAAPSRSFMPSWLSSAPSGSSVGRHSSATVIRKPSRAERSAAKNIKDAKKRGWQGTAKKPKKKGKKKAIDYEVASSAAWTDVSRTSQDGQGKGDKKCAVM